MEYNSIPVAFETKSAAAKFVGMNPSTFRSALKRNNGEFVIEGFKISERDEILVFKELDEAPIVAEVLEPTEEALEVVEVHVTTPYSCNNVDCNSRSELATVVGCSLSRIAELIRDARQSGGQITKQVRNKTVFVSSDLEDLRKSEAKLARTLAKDADDTSKLEKLEKRFASKAAKYNALGSDLEELSEAINALRGTSDDFHVIMSSL